MNIAERETKLHWLLGPYSEEHQRQGLRNIGDVHAAVEAVVGRPVWIHELMFEEELAEEIRTGQPSSMDDIIMRLQRAAGPNKPVLTIDVDTGDVRRIQ